MKSKLTKFAIGAGIMLALTFTLSCSGGGGGGSSSSNPSSSSEYTGGSCDVNDYETVVINGVTWMAKNWGCYVPSSKCYNNDPANCDKYGRLYDWATAMALPTNCNTNSCASQVSAKHQGICPNGWHLPSIGEWAELIYFVGGADAAGTKLKATSGWNEGGNGTDDYDFSALPGGRCDYGDFRNVGNEGYWWLGEDHISITANYMYMKYDSESIHITNWGKSDLLSVRCLQD